MVPIPDHRQTARVRIIQAHLSQDLKRMGCGLLRIGVDAVGYLQAINISLVLKVTAIRVSDWLSDETQDSKQQKDHGKSGPVAQFANVPPLLKAAKEPASSTINNIKSD